MVSPPLTAVLADYRAGLDAALELLARLEALSTRQRAEAGAPSDSPTVLEGLMAERQHLLDGLLRLDAQITPLRERISRELAEARTLPGFSLVAERQRTAAAAVSRIMRQDQDSVAALQQSDARRRADAQHVETAGATLAAYRRVLEGPQGPVGLVDERG